MQRLVTPASSTALYDERACACGGRFWDGDAKVVACTLTLPRAPKEPSPPTGSAVSCTPLSSMQGNARRTHLAKACLQCLTALFGHTSKCPTDTSAARFGMLLLLGRCSLRSHHLPIFFLSSWSRILLIGGRRIILEPTVHQNCPASGRTPSMRPVVLTKPAGVTWEILLTETHTRQ